MRTSKEQVMRLWNAKTARFVATRLVTASLLPAAVSISPTWAQTAPICVKATLKGPLKLRGAGSSCKPSEIQIGSFDGATIQFSGVNVQIVSGSGATHGPVNGTGNLIVGYNEGTCVDTLAICASDDDCAQTCVDGLSCSKSALPCTVDTDCSTECVRPDQTGSHNLVVGPLHTYPSSGGFLAGLANEATGISASVSGGFGNRASGYHASVSGGSNNVASGSSSSVSGGSANIASVGSTWVGGGQSNTASGLHSSVSGGVFNTASAPHASVSGGQSNTASGFYASVSGGQFNTASGSGSSVSGGTSVSETNNNGWSAGSSGSDSGPGKFFSH